MSASVVNNPRRLLVSLFDDEADYEDTLGPDMPTGRYYAWIQHDASIAGEMIEHPGARNASNRPDRTATL